MIRHRHPPPHPSGSTAILLRRLPQASGCTPPSSCPCADCVAVDAHVPALGAAWTSTPTPIPDLTLASSTYKARPGASTTSAEATTDQCLAGVLTSSFTRLAAKESSAERIGFEYYGSQALGNYVQWPYAASCGAPTPQPGSG